VRWHLEAAIVLRVLVQAVRVLVQAVKY
jgi:hypothetical protein